MAPLAAIFGCAGTRLTPRESGFFRDCRPWGFILFQRNVEDDAQLRALVDDLRDAAGHQAPVLIDQEGGRVARLLPPRWTGWQDVRPWLRGLPEPARTDAMRLRYRVIGQELRDLGIDVNCAPMADVAQPQTHPMIRARCYGDDPQAVAAAGAAVAEGLLAAGVLPVLKHIPGHGRPSADSHEELPQVDTPLAELEATDFLPFRALAHLPLGMTAHVRMTALDAKRPVTLSAPAMRYVRERIGFDGAMMSDDLSMGALGGPMGARVEAAHAAGCDLSLHCNGNPAEMEAIAEAAPMLQAEALRRTDAALALRDGLRPEQVPIPELLAQLRLLEQEARHA